MFYFNLCGIETLSFAFDKNEFSLIRLGECFKPRCFEIRNINELKICVSIFCLGTNSTKII